MTTRTERLEAALREAAEALETEGLMDSAGRAFALLAESGPSCCEETRERTLKEAAELCFHEEISSRCQFCSNYAVVLPMDAPGKPCGHESPSGAAKCELESGHQGTHIGSAKEGNTVRWLPPTTPPQANKETLSLIHDWTLGGATNPAPAIPVKPACPTCGGSKKITVVQAIGSSARRHNVVPCSDCGGEES